MFNFFKKNNNSLLSLSFLSVLVICVVWLAQVDAKSEVMINCFIKHLKSLKMIGEDFPEHDGNQHSNCTEVVKEAAQIIYKDCGPKTGFPDFDKHKPCIMDNLKSHRWVEKEMEQMVIVSSETISIEEKVKRAKEIATVNNQILHGALELCVNTDLYDSVFDSMLSRSKDDGKEDDPMSDYCKRKIVDDHNLIDKNVYTFIVNPTNLNVTGLNCTVNFNFPILNLDATSKLSIKNNKKTVSQCRTDHLNGNEFTARMFTLQILRKLNITNDQKASERVRFIEFVSNLFKNLIKCSF